jgi:hypothetical protein
MAKGPIGPDSASLKAGRSTYAKLWLAGDNRLVKLTATFPGR